MEFTIAEALGMTVASLRVELSSLEFQQWVIWFARRAQRQQIAR